MNRHQAGARLLALYPGAWRVRYGDEMADLLEGVPLTVGQRLDLVRGAIDAHLHPEAPSPIPVLATVGAAGLLTAHALVLAVQPAPPDWPGYLEEALPLVGLGVAGLVPAIVGLWLKLGDADGRIGRLGLVLGLVGYAAWLTAIAAAALRLEYGALTAAVSTVAMAGTAALGVALAGAGRLLLGLAVAGAALAGLAPPSLGWALFAAAWTIVGLKLLLDFDRTRARGGEHAG